MGYINGLVQERRNSSALTMELRLSCTNPSICYLLQSLKPVVIRMPTSFITGGHSCSSASDDKVGILTTFSFQCYGQYWPADISYTSLQDHQKNISNSSTVHILSCCWQLSSLWKRFYPPIIECECFTKNISIALFCVHGLQKCLFLFHPLQETTSYVRPV